LQDHGSDEFLLKQVAEFTGGRFNPAPKEVFHPAGRSLSTVLNLWPGLLALGIAFNLAELILRKWRGIIGS
jgi:hypothetical protein